MDTNNKDIDIENMINILDNFAKSDTGRLKVFTSEEMSQGETTSIHHLGRCDIGSPWARGCAFDVLEDEENNNGKDKF